MLHDVMVKQGASLFRVRGVLALLLVPAYVAALRHSEWLEQSLGDVPDDLYDAACVSVSVMGLALRLFTAGTVPRRTSGRNKSKGQVADVLNTTGAYSMVRNPLYLGNFLILLGLLLMPAVWWLVAIGACAFCLWHERIILAEEAFLQRQFGAQYARWAEETPAFIPSLRNLRPPALPFSLKTAIKREYLTAMILAGSLLALDYAEDLVALGPGFVSFELETTLVCGAVLAAGIVIRFLRMRTRVLHVAGR